MKFESRWPAIITILIVLALLEVLPGRVRVLPPVFPYILAFVLVAPMLAEQFTHNRILARFERFDIYAFAWVVVVLMLWTLVRLVKVMISPEQEVGGIPLLASAIALWAVNVLVFALLYWEFDRGGPDARASGDLGPPDILFPESVSSAPLSFIDYLFFAYTTSTAFSPTETFPLTGRLKALMMVQSTISLATILVVAGRAINILR
jgi:hypothetical protein